MKKHISQFQCEKSIRFCHDHGYKQFFVDPFVDLLCTRVREGECLFTRRGTLRRKPRKNYTITKRNINSMLILFLFLFFLFLFIFFFSLFLVANALTRITRHCFLILASIYIFYIYIYIYVCMYEYIYTSRSYKIYIYTPNIAVWLS